jgi:U4/U6 small nuclear ribonucleoprotein PRP31
MSTVAEDLLNDFGSSGDEAEEEHNDGLIKDEATSGNRDAMELDGDFNADADVKDGEDSENERNNREDSEARKVKVEKMQLGGVKDVQSVASLMRTLEPILEVSTIHSPIPQPLQRSRLGGRFVYISSFDGQP